MTLRSVFRLKIQQISQTCFFDLSWGRGQHLSATLHYPEVLTTLYREWQRVYLSFYSSNRGRVEETGGIAPPSVDWRAKLVQAEARLLSEFHRWLRSAELFEIRQKITSGDENLAEPGRYWIDLFLTCSSIDLARLPWEAWEIRTDFAPSTGKIRIARTSVNIGAKTVSSPRRRSRILAIVGDDTGLILEEDRKAVRSLLSIADVEFVPRQPGQDIATLTTEICEAIADEQGWDVLVFVGHSNENPLTGGELGLAPGISISINEISRQLTIAKERGLQFAIFNSCSGLSIAEYLISLGLSQVAVMRERIADRVAPKFFVQFLQELAEYKDVHEALLAACQYLKTDYNITYPSAYLVPSLFCHPDAVLFRIKASGLKERLRQLLPARREAIALSSLLLLGLLPPVQSLLLEPRLWAQAIYRDVTRQVPDAAPPPVLLVQIDEKSIRRSGISSPRPIDRSYLSSLVDKLPALNAKVVGVDYLLDRQQPGKDQLLAQSIRQSVKQGTWFVFAAQQNAEKERGLGALTGIASSYWSLQGYINAFPWYVELLSANASYHTCPFAYVLALAYALNLEPSTPDSPQPQLQSQTDFGAQVIDYLNRGSAQNSTAAFLRSRQSRLHPITSFSQAFDQLWLQPIVDFSIPPNRVYGRIAAWELLERSQSALRHRQIGQPVVIIAPGGYDEAGVKADGEDNFPVPMAIGYWLERVKAQGNSTSSSIDERDRASIEPQVFTGAEAQAYMIHHLLNQRLVMPIPDLWMVVVAVLLGKGTLLVLKQQLKRRGWTIMLVSATAVYGLTGLQVYISAGVLLPWLLPTAAFWICVLPAFSRKISYEQG